MRYVYDFVSFWVFLFSSGNINAQMISFLIAYRSYHYAIIQTGSGWSETFDVVPYIKRVLFWSGTLDVGMMQCYEHSLQCSLAVLQYYANIYSRDYNIGLSNLVPVKIGLPLQCSLMLLYLWGGFLYPHSPQRYTGFQSPEEFVGKLRPEPSRLCSRLRGQIGCRHSRRVR